MSMIQDLMEDLVTRIGQFDSEGVPGSVYDATRKYILNLLGDEAAMMFSGHMDANGDFFYFRDTPTMQRCVNQILEIVSRNMKKLSHL
jgi:hypothetical protein